MGAKFEVEKWRRTHRRTHSYIGSPTLYIVDEQRDDNPKFSHFFVVGAQHASAKDMRVAEMTT